MANYATEYGAIDAAFDAYENRFQSLSVLRPAIHDAREGIFRLRMDPLPGLGAVRKYSRLVDHAVMRALGYVSRYTGAVESPACLSVSVIAIEDYGCRQLSPFSKIKIVVLHDSSSDDERAIISVVAATRFLTEAGLPIEVAVQAMDEVTSGLVSDPSRDAMMRESRLVTGEQKHYLEMVRQSKSRSSHRLSHLLGVVRGRLVGEEIWTPVSSPNLTDTPGCLGDLTHQRQLLRAMMDEGTGGWPDRVVDRQVIRRLREARSFLVSIRSWNQLLTDSECSVVSLESWAQMVRVACPGIRLEGGPGEEWLRSFNHHRLNVLASLQEFEHDIGIRMGKGSVLSSAKEQLVGSDWKRDSGSLYPADVEALSSDPLKVLDGFLLSQKLGLPPSDEFLVGARKAMRTVGPGFLGDERTWIRFRAIFREAGRVADTLRFMHRAGLLVSLIPEFERCVGHFPLPDTPPQSADVRAIQAVAEVDQLELAGAGDDLQNLMRQISRPDLLKIALLLFDLPYHHENEDHATSPLMMSLDRLEFRAPEIEFVEFLLRQRSLLSDGVRRGGSDYREVAKRVGHRESLRTLYLMTVANSKSGRSFPWSRYSAGILGDLFHRTDQLLAADSGRPQESVPPLNPDLFNSLEDEPGGSLDGKSASDVSGLLTGSDGGEQRPTDEPG